MHHHQLEILEQLLLLGSQRLQHPLLLLLRSITVEIAAVGRVSDLRRPGCDEFLPGDFVHRDAVVERVVEDFGLARGVATDPVDGLPDEQLQKN